jgi:hypothetical protein
VTEHGTPFKYGILPIFRLLEFGYRRKMERSSKNKQLIQLVDELQLSVEFVISDKILKQNYFDSEKNFR